MKPVYERTDLMITEFDSEDVITTSGAPVAQSYEWENAYHDIRSLGAPGSWF